MEELQDSDINIFKEPDGFRPPTPPPTSDIFERDISNVLPGTPENFEYSLVGKHSLWAHVTWNAGILLAKYLDENKSLVKDKCVLELGAGAALPSMVATVNGAKKVVVTDYPDLDLINILRENITRNLSKYLDIVQVEGYTWGYDASDILNLLSPASQQKFDLIILCDLIFNHTQHRAMLQSCRQCLSEDGEIYCVFSHHVPKYAERDMKFFELAETEFQFNVEKLFTEKMTVMFKKDIGNEEMRRSVHVYRLSLRKISLNC